MQISHTFLFYIRKLAYTRSRSYFLVSDKCEIKLMFEGSLITGEIGKAVECERVELCDTTFVDSCLYINTVCLYCL